MFSKAVSFLVVKSCHGLVGLKFCCPVNSLLSARHQKLELSILLECFKALPKNLKFYRQTRGKSSKPIWENEKMLPIQMSNQLFE